MIRYCKNNNWTPTGIILNKNDMSRSYILLNDKDNVMPRNRRHLIKMNSNFVKIENHNDMDNHTETELKQDIACQRLNLEKWTNLDRMWVKFEKTELHNSIRKESNQAISMWWIVNSENINCKMRMLCVTILFHHLFVFVYSISIVFMLLHYLATTPSLSYSQTKAHLIHFIYHSLSHSFHLTYSISFILLIIIHHFHIYLIWSYSSYIVIHSYFHTID